MCGHIFRMIATSSAKIVVFPRLSLHSRVGLRSLSTSTKDIDTSAFEDDPVAVCFPDPSDPKQNPLAQLGPEEMSEDQRYWRQRAAESPPAVYKRCVEEDGRAYAVGRRKRSVARVWLRDGEGGITVNGKNFVDMFNRLDHRDQIVRPLVVTGKVGKFTVEGIVAGGGNTGQAEALRHGIAKALQKYDPRFRPKLKSDGLLTRDSRVVESKKYGRKKARKSFQWVKR